MERERKDAKLTYKGSERQRVRDTEIQRGTREMAEWLRAQGLLQKIWVPFPYLMVAYRSLSFQFWGI